MTMIIVARLGLLRAVDGGDRAGGGQAGPLRTHPSLRTCNPQPTSLAASYMAAVIEHEFAQRDARQFSC